MGKHYRDPDDKPVLGDGMCLTADYLMLTASERNCSLYCMQLPENLITAEPVRYQFYLSREACVRNIATHNNGRINKVNGGNKRKARLLVYTADECTQYVLKYINASRKES